MSEQSKQSWRQQGDTSFRMLVDGVKDYAIFLLDPDGTVATWNTGARILKGYEPEEIIGLHFSRFYPPEAVAIGWPERELEIARTQGRFEDEGWRLRKDGTRFWANVVITALHDAQGTLMGFAKVTRDLSERKRNEEATRESEERFRLLVEAVRDYAIFMLDTEGRVASWNSGAHQIKGYTAEEIIGRHFSVFYPPEAIAAGWPAHELDIARAQGRYEEEGWRVRKDRTMFWANVVITAVHDQAGTLRGYAKVTRDLTERKRVEALEEGRRQTTEFLAMLAHELRNPLAPIRNAVHVMSSARADSAASEWCRGVIDRQVSQLARLVDDLLDVTRITSGKIVLHREPIEIASVVQHAVESAEPIMKARRHAFSVSVPEGSLQVEGDKTRLSQALLNLLTNAAKYTPEGGAIECAVTRDNGTVVMSVRDNGIGIPQDLLPNVFELFVQGERSLARSEGGLGVGLTLVDRLVRLHGGSVHAQSAGPGQGSEFIVRLPLHQAGAQRHEPRSTGQVSPPGARRVLVVEDNHDSAETLAAAVRAWNFEVQTCFDGAEAIVAAQAFRPHALLLDIGLPKLSGYEVAKQIRKLPGLENALLLAITGYSEEEDRRRSHEAGIQHHFGKPIDLGVLKAILFSLSPATASAS